MAIPAITFPVGTVLRSGSFFPVNFYHEISHSRRVKYLLLIIFTTLLCSCGQSGGNSERHGRHGSDSVNSETSRLSDGVQYDKSAATDVVGEWPPSLALITADLTGHSLTEGVRDGYHRKDWTFDIEYGDVSDLRIDSVLACTTSKYLVIVDMKLSKRSGNFYYRTKARINYIKSPDDNSPKLDYVTSLGMEVVSDGEFDGDISCELADDGWGGVNCLKIKNNGEIALAVGGRLLAGNEWIKFATLVPSNEEVPVGGTFSGGSVSDFRIDFVVREN